MNKERLVTVLYVSVLSIVILAMILSRFDWGFSEEATMEPVIEKNISSQTQVQQVLPTPKAEPINKSVALVNKTLPINIPITFSRADLRIGNATERANLTSKRDLFLGDEIVDAWGYGLFKEHLPNFLASGVAKTLLGEEIPYVQKMTFFDGLTFSNYSIPPKDARIYGFNLSLSQKILKYSLDFSKKVAFQEMTGMTISFFGRKYYVYSAPLGREIMMLDSPYSFELKKNHIISIAYPKAKEFTISISEFYRDYVILNVSGEVSVPVYEGNLYAFKGLYFYIEELVYDSDKENGLVRFVVSSRKASLIQGSQFFVGGEYIPGLEVDFYTPVDDGLRRIDLTWELTDPFNLDTNSTLSSPGEGGIRFTIDAPGITEDDEYYAYVYMDVDTTKLL